jgi:hypothetical protein
MPHLPLSHLKPPPVPPVAEGGGSGFSGGTARGALNSQCRRRLCISRAPLILNARLLTLELNALNLVELVGDTTQFESIAVTKVTEGPRSETGTSPRIRRCFIGPEWRFC